jgi:hypothetical protein
MRKLILPAVLVAALVPASIAVANGGLGFGASNPTAVAATFSATQTKTSTRTCTTSDNRTIVVTDGTYTGTATGDATLAGAMTIRARSVIDTTNKVGLVTGQFGIDTSGQPNARGSFQAVYSAGQIAGLATGRAGASHTSLVANLSAAFDPSTGFAAGSKLGGGTSGGNAVELTSKACQQSNQPPTTHERSSAHGTISAISTGSITVAGLTCVLPSGSDVSTKYKQNDVVTIQCELSNGQNTLTSIDAKGGKHH